VLIVSAWHAGRLGRVTYLLGDVALEDGTPRFVPRGGGLVDAGHDFYAPAVLNEPGRALLWGWSWEERPDVEAVASGWAGVLTLPRELEVRDGTLTSRPVREVERLRRDAERRDVDLADSGTRVELSPGPLDLEIVLEASNCEPVVVLLEGDGPACHIDVQPDPGRVRLRHPARHEERRSWATETPLPRSWDGQLRVVMDGDLVEVHVSGAAPFTERMALPANGRRYVSFHGPLSGRCRLRVWPLDPITVTDTTQVLSPIA
jgi:beta-fructofuranosidase